MTTEPMQLNPVDTTSAEAFALMDAFINTIIEMPKKIKKEMEPRPVTKERNKEMEQDIATLRAEYGRLYVSALEAFKQITPQSDYPEIEDKFLVALGNRAIKRKKSEQFKLAYAETLSLLNPQKTQAEKPVWGGL